ncbi:DUF4349 domain-containing protein [Clostridium sp. CS001]|uniref:DUF4349 domain-containing protein n=1 Tax=Clostridium sp. CS001 TaxID=2880648 RepID=UPI001CF3F9F8|nr:DUF4349 domain-containing protein [Clostridium sp. CS001]MCB2289078.1 DUF4349 domain-containing protein [Clostridium sp. CS001]
MKRKSKNIIAIIVAIILISVLAIGCGKKGTASNENKVGMPVPQADAGFGTNGNVVKDDAKSNNNSTVGKEHTPLSSNSLEGQGKIIRNGTIQMETLNFDETVEYILSKTNTAMGYVQSSNVSGKSIESKSYEERRRGQFTLRIPKTKFDDFILDVGKVGSITSKQISSEDVTSAYFDTQAHLKSLNIQEERLIELLKKTGELKDIIVVEKELTSVRYEIEGLTGNLKKWDNLIDFSTLSIELSEVYDIKEDPGSFGGKIINGFTSSLKSLLNFGKDLVVVISISIPYLVILTIILLIVRFVYKRRKISK